jgi:alkylhydroperoxidase family enzyme
MSESQPRIAPLPLADRTEGQRALLTAVLGDRAPNLFTTLVRHPALFRTWLPFCMELLTNSAFPPRERELLIIRTAWLCGSTYELGHHRELGADEGLTEHDLAAVTGDISPAWTHANGCSSPPSTNCTPTTRSSTPLACTEHAAEHRAAHRATHAGGPLHPARRNALLAPGAAGQ